MCHTHDFCKELMVAGFPMGHRKMDKIREFDWPGKVRESAELSGKSAKVGK